jgi:HlyD family secretion protein
LTVIFVQPVAMPELFTNHRTRNWIWLAVLAAAALVAALGYVRFGRAVDALVVEVKPGSVAQQVTGPGTVQARSAVTLASRLTATVVEVHADVGDTVETGQLLVVLDDREATARLAAVRSQQQALANNIQAARAAVERAEAELALAESRQRRDADLQAQGFVSAAATETTAAGLKVAAAGLESARATLAARQSDAGTLAQEALAAETALSHTQLASPLSGLVVQRLAEPGSTVGVGSPILKLIDPATLWVATRVDESVVGKVALGQNARIRLRSGEEVAGEVARIARQSDAATRELDVFVAFGQRPDHFAIDQEAAVTIETGRAQGLVIPATALLKDRNGQTGVWRVVDGRTVFQPLTSAGAHGGEVLVAQGLQQGETILLNAADFKVNQPVRPVPAP